MIARDKLNEDPGFWFKQVGPNDQIKIHHPDEVYARVTVSRVSSGSSPAVSLVA